MKNIVIKPISELVPYANNPRRNDAAVDKVAESIRLYGFQQPLVIDKQGVIVVGHTRYRAAKQLGLDHVPCLVSELSDIQNNEYRIVDNKTNEYAAWDFEKLEQELQGLNLAAFNFDWGFEFPETEKEIVQDEVPELESELESFCQKGDIVELGRHRLLCGDSTSAEDMRRLMDGAAADLLLTDPPYNVNYEGGTSDKLKILNDKMEDASFQAFLTDAFACAHEVLKPGGVFYIWHAESEGFNFRAACKAVGWQVRQCLVWVKNTIVMGRQDYQWKHEPCLYGWKDGAAHIWKSDRKQSTVLEFSKPTRNDLHPTMKPVELFAYLIRNSSQEEDLVLDSFAGSGTTLIACEQLGRSARLMELDPRYCDVIVERYINFTKSTEGVRIYRGSEVLSWKG